MSAFVRFSARSFLGALIALAGLAPGAASAAGTLESIRAKGFVQCGSVVRPGLATANARNEWSGLEVEVCRAVATAIFGAKARFAYHRYESEADFASLRNGEDDLSFLSFAEMAQHHLVDRMVPGPTVFVESDDVMVAENSPVQRASALQGSSVCFIIGTPTEDKLDAWLDDHKVELTRFAFQEEGEMYDAYTVQRCKSVAGESTALAAARLDGGVRHLQSRLLPDHLANFPIVAATPIGGDARFGAIAAWTIHTLLAADQHESHYHADGVRAMSIDGTGLGLAKDWQHEVIATVGSYAAIFDRTLGSASPFKLRPGLNASAEAGGLLVHPHSE